MLKWLIVDHPNLRLRPRHGSLGSNLLDQESFEVFPLNICFIIVICLKLERRCERVVSQTDDIVVFVYIRTLIAELSRNSFVGQKHPPSVTRLYKNQLPFSFCRTHTHTLPIMLHYVTLSDSSWKNISFPLLSSSALCIPFLPCCLPSIQLSLSLFSFLSLPPSLPLVPSFPLDRQCLVTIPSLISVSKPFFPSAEHTYTSTQLSPCFCSQASRYQSSLTHRCGSRVD